jgi:chromosome segregation ATPase
LKDIDELKAKNLSLQKEIFSFKEKNSLYMEQLKEKDNYLEAMKQQIEDLNCGRETNLKDIDELKTNNEILQKEIISLEEKYSLYMEQLKQKDNYLEALKQQIEDLNYARDTNLKYVGDLETNIVDLQMEIHSLEEKNSVHMEQLKEKDNCLEAMKQQIEDLNCSREANLKDIDELKTNNVSLHKEITSLEEKNSLYMEQLKEKDNYLEAMKQQIEDLNCGRETNLKDTAELKFNNEILQKEIISHEEKISLYMEQLKEEDNYLVTMKQQIEDLHCGRETTFKDIDELIAKNKCLQKEIISLEENNSLYMEQLKEKDNYLETMKQQIEDLNCGREANLKDIDELKTINESLQNEIISLEEKNSVYMEQLKEKDNYLVTMKQQIEDLNCGRIGRA